MTIWNDLAARNRNIQRPLVGGTYGEQTIRLPGLNPVAGLTFIRDGVIIKSDDDTAQYSTPAWEGGNLDTGNQISFRSPATAHNRQVFLAFETPIGNISLINISLGELFAQADNSVSGQSRFFVQFAMIKVPLLSGTFDIKTLTYTLGHHKSGTNSTTQGTLYDTAANFEEISDFALGQCAAANSDSAAHIAQSDAFTGVGSLTKAARQRSIAFEPALDNGPYFGIHMFVQEGVDSQLEFATADVRNPRSLNNMNQSWAMSVDLLAAPDTPSNQ